MLMVVVLTSVSVFIITSKIAGRSANLLFHIISLHRSGPKIMERGGSNMALFISVNFRQRFSIRNHLSRIQKKPEAQIIKLKAKANELLIKSVTSPPLL